jgi:hypothetical protein
MTDHSIIVGSQEQRQSLWLHDALLGEDLAETLKQTLWKITKILNIFSVFDDLLNAKLSESFCSDWDTAVQFFTLDLASLSPTPARSSFRF